MDIRMPVMDGIEATRRLPRQLRDRVQAVIYAYETRLIAPAIEDQSQR
jgi:CheY-like chemotaxis protein